MKTLSEHDSGRRIRFTMVLLAAIGATVLWSAPVPNANAKGAVDFELCGELKCVEKKSMRFTAAMLFGGRMHDGPSCGTRVHTVTASFPGVHRDRRYLLVASRGLIGEQGKAGFVWWRKIGGSRKGLLAKAVTPTGMGFNAEPEIDSSILSVGDGPAVARWRLRSNRMTCAPNGLAGTVEIFDAIQVFEAS